MALAAATVPMPLWASTSASAGLSLTTSQRRRGSTRPSAIRSLIAAQALHALAVAGVEAQLREDQRVGRRCSASSSGRPSARKPSIMKASRLVACDGGQARSVRAPAISEESARLAPGASKQSSSPAGAVISDRDAGAVAGARTVGLADHADGASAPREVAVVEAAVGVVERHEVAQAQPVEAGFGEQRAIGRLQVEVAAFGRSGRARRRRGAPESAP